MKVWDFATRVYHWLQVLLVVALLASGNSGNGPHIQLGLVLFTIVLWRLVWGFVGSETNRFKQFVYSPLAAWRYVKKGQTSHIGHNPLGGWMVVTLVITLLLQCLSGLAIAGFFDTLPGVEWWLNDDIFAAVESLHSGLASLLPILIALHVGAVVIYKLKKKPLVKAMFTGRQVMLTTDIEPFFVSQWRALFVLVVAVLVTIAIVAISMV